MAFAAQTADLEPIIHRVSGLPHQTEGWGNLDDLADIALVAPLGTGKTYFLAIKSLILSYVNRPLPGMLVVPTYDMGLMIHAEEWPVILAELGVRLTWRPGKRRFEWPWGGVMWLRSAEKPQRLVGGNLAYVLWDEPGQMDREAWDKGSVRVRHPQGKVRQNVLGGTPEGLNWYADVFDMQPGEVRRTSLPGGKMLTQRTIRGRSWHAAMAHYPSKLKQTFGYDDALMSAYGRGLFVAMRTGRAYRTFTREQHVQPVRHEPSLPLIIGCDFNVDYMRWLILQIGKDWIGFLDEIRLPKNRGTEDAGKEVVRRWGQKHRGQVVVTGDAAGQARSTSGETDYKIAIEELKRANFKGLSLNVPAANPRVKDRVDTMNYHLSGRGKTVMIDPSCKDLIRDLERVQWKEKSQTPELDKSDITLTHASDAATYPVHRLARAGVIHGGMVSIPDDVMGPEEIVDGRF